MLGFAAVVEVALVEVPGALSLPPPVPRPNPSGVITVIDVLPNRSSGFLTARNYATVPIVGTAFTLLISLGTDIFALQPIALHFTGPGGQNFPSDDSFVFVGSQPLQLEESIDPFTYVVYQTATAEFVQAGLWQVTVQTTKGQYGPYFFAIASQ